MQCCVLAFRLCYLYSIFSCCFYCWCSQLIHLVWRAHFLIIFNRQLNDNLIGISCSFISQEKREQILNELGTLSEACCYPGLVEFHGAFYKPNSGAIYFALEYMDGGSLADIIRVKKFILEPVLAHMLVKVLSVWNFFFQMLIYILLMPSLWTNKFFKCLLFCLYFRPCATCMKWSM